jgi:hypothetical protein
VSDQPRYLVRMETPRGCFYLCGNLADGVYGWAASDLDPLVTHYQLMWAARAKAQQLWDKLNTVFEVLAIEVITPMGETMWAAGGRKVQP